VIGIALVGWLILRKEMIGVGLLCGMGMTVSVVITDISATGSEVESLHSGIYLASLISGLLGFLWFRVKS
jgi:Na+/H+ antiporter NhaA